MPRVQPKVIGDFLLTEGPGKISREKKTVASGNSIRIGQVCRTLSTGKKAALAGTGNEVHTYTPDAAPTAGTFRLALWHKDGYVIETDDIAYNATNTAIAAAVNLKLGTSAVSCTGTMATTVALTFSGTGYSAISHQLGTMDVGGLTGTASAPATRSTSAGAAVNDADLVNIQGSVSGGTLRFWVSRPDGGRVLTGTAAHDGTFANVITNINTALDAATGVTGGIVATGTAYTGITLTYSGTGYAGLAWPPAQIIQSSLTGATFAHVTKSVNGGLAGAQASNVADSIALEDIDASSADATGTFLTRIAEVNPNKLYYGGGDPTGCQTSLVLVNIISRTEPTIQQVGP